MGILIIRNFQRALLINMHLIQKKKVAYHYQQHFPNIFLRILTYWVIVVKNPKIFSFLYFRLYLISNSAEYIFKQTNNKQKWFIRKRWRYKELHVQGLIVWHSRSRHCLLTPIKSIEKKFKNIEKHLLALFVNTIL